MLEVIAASAPIAALRTTPTLYGIVNALHIIGLATLFGAILTLDLRVLGIFRPKDWRGAMAVASPVAGIGLAVAVTTGALLFAVRPSHYLANGPFLVKLALVALASLNVALFHLRCRRMSSERPDLTLRLSAFVSVLAWTAAIFAGRFIAFT
jgi:hypothetical protein